MSKIFDKAIIQTAVNRRTNLDLSCRHTTTSDFFQLNVPYIRRMVPGEKLNVNVSSFARLAGMPKPTFGDARLNLRAFFVPYRMIFKGWNDFITDTPHVWSNLTSSPSIPSSVPLLRASSVTQMFVDDEFSRAVGMYTSDNFSVRAEANDYILQNGANTFTHTVYLFGVRPEEITFVVSDDGDYNGFFTEDGRIGVDYQGSIQRKLVIGTYTFDDETGKLVFTGNEQSPNISYSIGSFSFNGGNVQFDFEYRDQTGAVEYRKFLPIGRFAFKVWRQLGYPAYFDLQNEQDAQMTHYSALELFSFVKLYLDYYFPAQYYGAADRTAIERVICNDTPDYVLSDVTFLKSIFRLFYFSNYQSDYFTAAFDNPTGPNSSAISDIILNDVSNPNTQIYSADQVNYETPSVMPDPDTGFSQYALMALRKLTDYVKRHQLAGARAVDRLFARFGIRLDNNQINRSFYLGSHHVSLVVGDVMATADTIDGQNGAALGDYAGKGFITGKDGHFEFDSGKDYGIFFIVSSIVPNSAYYQGYDIHTLKTTKLDFYTPEFDGLGTRALEKGELVSDSRIDGQADIRGIFGFTPQYAEYKIPYDRLTGDFNYPSLSEVGFTSDSWHLFRKFNYESYSQVVHSLNFVKASDAIQYNRIFYNMTNSADHFVINYLFNVSASAPVKPLYDSYEFEHDEGAQVSVDVNGQRVN